jgi:VWFA-related protein
MSRFGTSALSVKALALVLAGLMAASGFPQAPSAQSAGARSPQGTAQSNSQGQPQNKQNPAPPSVRVTTRMVQVSVIVHDKDGNPVTGLTKDDFTLLDQGQRQQISSFAEQKSCFTNAAAPANPNLFTNKFEQGVNAQPPLTVIVVDAYNTRYRDIMLCLFTQRAPCALPSIFFQAEKFFSQMQPQDRVALYELADKLYLLQDFTSDPNALRQGLDRGKGLIPSSFPPSQSDPINMSDFTMNSMRAIADRLAVIPGRKNLIWLSTGFSARRIITDEKIDSTAKTLGNADLPLFAVDAKGLFAPPNTASRGPIADITMVSGRGSGPPGGFNPIRNLSEASGGRAFYNTNDLAGAIRRVIDDSAATYLLGYYPDHNKWNGEFREIKVKVNRPGVEVRSRPGYFAVADSASAPEREAKKLDDAIRSPLESTDLAIEVEADGVEVSGARQLKVKVTLDAGQLRFQQQGDKWTDTIGRVWAEFDAEGRQVGTLSKPIDLSLTQDEYKQLAQKGYGFSETLALAKDAAEVHLVLRDAGTGAIGSVIIPLSRLFKPPVAQPQPQSP